MNMYMENMKNKTIFKEGLRYVKRVTLTENVIVFQSNI